MPKTSKKADEGWDLGHWQIVKRLLIPKRLRSHKLLGETPADHNLRELTEIATYAADRPCECKAKQKKPCPPCLARLFLARCQVASFVRVTTKTA